MPAADDIDRVHTEKLDGHATAARQALCAAVPVQYLFFVLRRRLNPSLVCVRHRGEQAGSNMPPEWMQSARPSYHCHCSTG